MAKYLITGGAGFIGSNIVKKLLELKESVRIVDDFSTGRRENLEDLSGFELIEGDLSKLDVARQVVKGMDYILHQAAIPSVQRSVEDPIKSNNANITATLNVLVAARDEGVKKLVYAASSSAYGDNPELPKKEDFPARPISPYALTKYAGERYCQIFYNLYGLPTICLRYFNVFGPKQNPNSQYAAVIPNFINSLLKRQSPVIFGTGEQSRDFTFVGNVVEANLLAAKSEKGLGEVFNIACGQRTSLNDLVSILKEIIKADVKVEYKGGRQGDVLHSLADISKARELLGYSPVVSLKDGLIKTVEFYEKGK